MRSIASGVAWSLVLMSCLSEVESPPEDVDVETTAAVAKGPRYAAIKDAAAVRGLRNGYLLAGIANTISAFVKSITKCAGLPVNGRSD
jgi:hypothetical protein